MIILETPRLILRHFVPDDLDNLFALYSDPDIRRYIPDCPTTYEDTQEQFNPQDVDLNHRLFRDEGRKVLFMMDSVTRYAMAQREIGLAVGEPPTSRGYTPSVFSVLPRLLERTGMGETGSITALYTVLVDGDDMNEPIADAVRGILDGHVVLSRALATANHFPAVDVLESVSRVTLEVCQEKEISTISKARDLLSVYRKNEDVITIGAYTKGSSPNVDLAIEKQPLLRQLLRQPIEDNWSRERSFAELTQIVE